MSKYITQYEAPSYENVETISDEVILIDVIKRSHFRASLQQIRRHEVMQFVKHCDLQNNEIPRKIIENYLTNNGL